MTERTYAGITYAQMMDALREYYGEQDLLDRARKEENERKAHIASVRNDFVTFKNRNTRISGSQFTSDLFEEEIAAALSKGGTLI